MKNLTVILLVTFILFTAIGQATAFNTLKSEENLAKTMVGILGKELEANPAPKDSAYYNFMLATYSVNWESLEKAEEYYEANETPLNLAYLGSLETIKGRDFAGGGAMGTLLSFTPAGLVRVKRVYSGAKKLDDALVMDKNSIDIRVIRGWNFYNLPAIFDRFEDGFEDVKWILAELKSEKTITQGDHYDIRKDVSSLYYLGALYYNKVGDTKEATRLFKLSASSSANSPYAKAAKKLLAMQVNNEVPE